MLAKFRAKKYLFKKLSGEKKIIRQKRNYWTTISKVQKRIIGENNYWPEKYQAGVRGQGVGGKLQVTVSR